MSKFTPGPWMVSGELIHTPWDESYGRPTRMPICDVPGKYDRRLIAKAPEMYDMIEELRKVLITIYDTNHMAPMIDRYLRDIKELQNQIRGE